MSIGRGIVTTIEGTVCCLGLGFGAGPLGVKKRKGVEPFGLATPLPPGLPTGVVPGFLTGVGPGLLTGVGPGLVTGVGPGLLTGTRGGISLGEFPLELELVLNVFVSAVWELM